MPLKKTVREKNTANTETSFSKIPISNRHIIFNTTRQFCRTVNIELHGQWKKLIKTE